MKPEFFAEKISGMFREELTYYTHPDVQTTAHQVGNPISKNWTSLLNDIGIIQYNGSIDRYTELERTLSALYCFELSQDENLWPEFTEAQNGSPDKLTEGNYAALCIDIKKMLGNHPEAEKVLACLILYSDLGKSPVTRMLAKSAGIDPTLDPDDLMLEILQLEDKEIIKILPSFAELSNGEKKMLKSAYPLMTACLGHLYFLEGGAKTFEIIAKALQNIDPEKRRTLLRISFFAQFFNGAGSQGQMNMAGSVTCTNQFYEGYMLMHEFLHTLKNRLAIFNNAEKSASMVFEKYLIERGRWLELDIFSFNKREDFEFVMRLACTLQINDPKVVKQLVSIFYQLDPAYQDLLTEQLSFNINKGICAFARTPHYIATAAQNISREDFAENHINEAIRKALDAEICLAMLVRDISENHPEAAKNAKMPLSFGKLAWRASEPEFFNPAVFDATLATWTIPRHRPTGTIKNLIFDLGHVFIEIDTTRLTVFRAFSELAKKHGKEMTTAEVGLLFTEKDTDEVVLAFHRGSISTADFRQLICQKLGLESISDEAFDEAFTASILADPNVVRQRLAYMEELIKQGYNICLLSNNNEIHRTHTKQNYSGMHWGKYFFKQYYSNETGWYKPDAEGYMQILKENRFKPEETLFFDDVMKYIDAAWKYGIRARQFTVKYPITDIQLITDAISRNETSGANVSRQSSMLFYVASKWKQVAGINESEQKLRLS